MRLNCAILAALMTCAVANAQTVSPFPPAPFRFTGNWDCAGSFANGKPHHSTFRGEVILKDTWLRLEETDVEPNTGYVAHYLIGYDSTAKKIVEFDANNFSAAMYTSDEGWKDDTLILTSAVSGATSLRYVQDRVLFHIDSPDGFTMDWQTRRTVDAPWTPADHLPCRRIPEK